MKTESGASHFSSPGTVVFNRAMIFLCMYYGIMLNCNAQMKQDYRWFFGIDQDPDSTSIQAYQIDFNLKPLEVKPHNHDLGFDNMNASICDNDGRLLFYSNGCAVANSDGMVMPHGDSINSGRFFWEWWGGNCDYGYPGFQDILILPDPANESGYYILHKPSIWDPVVQSKIFVRDFLFSYVDMRLAGGKGDVTVKNQLFFRDQHIQVSYFTAISHANGRDWWILQPSKDSNNYYTFLLDPSGIHWHNDQYIGPVFGSNSSASGTAKFSPDGSKYAYYNEDDGLLLFDFDRHTGVLSNSRQIMVYDTSGQGIFCSVEWSTNSRFIYCATLTHLHQVDTWAVPLESGIELIDVYNGTLDPYSTVFFLMAQGPDCRIYMCPTSSARSYHVIHYPDRKGRDCEFVQNGIRLPIISGVASMPNFPRWRVEEEEKCDSTIVSILGEPVHYVRTMRVYPNPTVDIIYLDLPEGLSGNICVLDVQGSPVFTQRLKNSIPDYSLDLGKLAPGLYVVEFYPDHHPKRVIYSAKVIVQR
jgi:hypothetical protein